MYSLKLNKYKNLRILLTNKYLIIVNQNGIIKFKTNFGKHYLQEEKHGRLYHGTGCGDYQQPLYPV